MNLAEATAKSEWETPAWVLFAVRQALSIKKFSYDPASSWRNPAGAALFSTPESDGLAMDWNDPLCGRYLWLNPPWGKKSPIRPWIDKFVTYDGVGTLLCPVNTGAKWFQHLLLHSDGDHIFFAKGRINFVDPSTGKVVKGCPFDSCLVLRNWCETEAHALWRLLQGCLVDVSCGPIR